MPFSHNRLKTTTGIQVFSQVNRYTLSYRFLYGNVQGCVIAKNRQVSLNWTEYNDSAILNRPILNRPLEFAVTLVWAEK